MSPEQRRTGLSKSRFTVGLQCMKQLWWRVHEPDAPELEPGPGLEAIFERGHLVGVAAQERFSDGVLIDLPHEDIRGRVEATARALADGARVVFEAAFTDGGVFVAADILERQDRGFALVEVKSTLDVKDCHIPDVAVQLHVLRQAGLEVPRAELMHLKRECRHPDLSNLFVREDVTHDVENLLPSIPSRIDGMHRMLGGPLPDVATGPHCSDPYECPFANRCWPPLSDHHVSTLYGVREKRVSELVEAGFETVSQLPDAVELSPVAARQVRSVRTGQLVAEPELAQALSSILSPVAFLDFETVAPAIPVWPGCRPYEAVPVQVSCHVQMADGRLVHHAFLAEGGDDPRPGVARAVLEACGGAATLVAYGAGFERRCLRHLADAVPAGRDDLLALSERVLDLHPIVRNHVYHPDFGGSFSLKSVLPALVPDLSYDDLAIAEGALASARLESLLLGEVAHSGEERRALRRDLLAYCERDTLGMVRLVERLRALA
ncbi:MAG: hypothetical protein A2V77_23210 [Anaeromyxobacter sp. RBG_16_69_14]|nr:MAG: hypothetical protein A2V77_23210 [Anaeromyxobacter sp. RBG_16_69_14]